MAGLAFVVLTGCRAPLMDVPLPKEFRKARYSTILFLNKYHHDREDHSKDYDCSNMSAFYAAALHEAGHEAWVVIFDLHEVHEDTGERVCHAVVKAVVDGETWFFDPLYQRKTKTLEEWGEHHIPPDVIPVEKMRYSRFADELRF